MTIQEVSYNWHCPKCKEPFTVAKNQYFTFFLTVYGAYKEGDFCPRCHEGLLILDDEEDKKFTVRFFNQDQTEHIDKGPYCRLMVIGLDLYAFARKQDTNPLHLATFDGKDWMINDIPFDGYLVW